MKKLLMALVVILAAAASLQAKTEAHVMVSAWAPGQIPFAMRNLKGARLNLIYGDCQNIHGFDFGLIGCTREAFRGFQLNACNKIGTDGVGAQVGLFNFVGTGFDGFQLSLWNGVFGGGVAGCQVAVCNSVDGDFAGFQLGGVNLVDGSCSGFQLGLWNDVDKTMKGFQLGVVNTVGKLDGLQIGLVNWIDAPTKTCHCLPIVNFGW